MKPQIQIPRDLFVSKGKEIEAVLTFGVKQALKIHKVLGNPIAVLRNGKVTIIPPEDIEI